MSKIRRVCKCGEWEDQHSAMTDPYHAFVEEMEHVMTDTEKRIAEIERDNTSRLPMPSADVEWLIAELRASQAECAKLEGIYASAVNGRAEMRTALKEERAKRPLGITEWSTVENVERVIAERDALKAKLAEAVAHLEAAVSGDWYPHKTAAFLASLKVAP